MKNKKYLEEEFFNNQTNSYYSNLVNNWLLTKTEKDKLLDKYDKDYSTADIAYERWLYFQKDLNDETIIEKIFQARGYKHIMEKHSYQMEYYFENILDKCKFSL